MNNIATLRQNPVVARLLDNAGWQNEFLHDVRQRALSSGRLSVAQIAAVERAIEREDRRAQWAEERRAEAQRLAAAGIQAPEGRATVTGVVVSAKLHQSDFGNSIKIVVQSDDGWKVWSTAPASLLADVDTAVIEEVREALLNKRVTFTATLTRSPSDAAFAFGKRPSKAEFVTA